MEDVYTQSKIQQNDYIKNIFFHKIKKDIAVEKSERLLVVHWPVEESQAPSKQFKSDTAHAMSVTIHPARESHVFKSCQKTFS